MNYCHGLVLFEEGYSQKFKSSEIALQKNGLMQTKVWFSEVPRVVSVLMDWKFQESTVSEKLAKKPIRYRGLASVQNLLSRFIVFIKHITSIHTNLQIHWESSIQVTENHVGFEIWGLKLYYSSISLGKWNTMRNKQ